MAVKSKTRVKRKARRAMTKIALKKSKKKNIAAGYDQYKIHDGQQYTGMRIGGTHKWFYDKGEWKETKITPDLWRVSYSVIKRRAGKAPKGSGTPVGTGYHWYLLAHQTAEKLNADDYNTSLIGVKYKLAHKRASKNNWNIKTTTQRHHLIQFLKEMIEQLETAAVPIDITYEDKEYKGEAVPLPGTCKDGICYMLDLTLNDEPIGIIRLLKNGWKLDQIKEQKLVDAIGNEIMAHYK